MPAVAPQIAVHAGAGVLATGALAADRLVAVSPALPALRALFPAGGLRRGSTVAVSGSTSLALALLAGPSQEGAWCAAVGVPWLGAAAAGEMGVALDRLALVPDPGRDWPAVVAALVDALDVVLVAPPAQSRPRAGDARRLGARVRERGGVLVALGAWEGADVRLAVTHRQWLGLGDGHGRLRACRMEVVAEGRGAAARPRRAELWLPPAPA